MIIGISGKIGSGKDTVGQIIQYLTWNKHNNVPDITIMDYLNGVEDYYAASFVGDIDYTISKESGWEVKKFADKLKDIVCLLIGCTREMLEDRTFKEAPLSEEWDRYGVRFIYPDDSEDDKLCGKFATHEEAVKYEKHERRALQWPNDLRTRIDKQQMTPRLMLQLIGTEGGRDIIHTNVWVNSLMADYKGFDDAPESVPESEKYLWNRFPNWLITDTRFPNEAEAVLSKKGLLIRVNRGDGNTGNHPSEVSLDNYEKWSEVIDNNGTMEELIEKVREILTRREII